MHQGLTKPKAVIFDWDHTLTHPPFYGFNECVATVRTYLNRRLSMEQIRDAVVEEFYDVIDLILEEKTDEARQIFVRKFPLVVPHPPILLKDSEAVLKSVQAKGIYTALVSNKMNILLRFEVSLLHFQDYFSLMIGSGDTEADKPSTKPLMLALSRSNLAPNRDVWFVGDSVTDMQCATDAGCTPVLYDYFQHDKSLFGDAPPALTVSNHKDLCEILEGLGT